MYIFGIAFHFILIGWLRGLLCPYTYIWKRNKKNFKWEIMVQASRWSRSNRKIQEFKNIIRRFYIYNADYIFNIYVIFYDYRHAKISTMGFLYVLYFIHFRFVPCLYITFSLICGILFSFLAIKLIFGWS